MKKVCIDGKSGTTGLRIYQRLGGRDDIEFISIPDELRKDRQSRAKMLNDCDIAFLCLPDTAAIEAVSMIENPDVIVIDTSTAHRTNPEFAYGFPELSKEHREKIRSSRRIAVPGCHASGFIALIYPLVRAGLLSPDASLVCQSVTGYSGGGREMIAEYESGGRPGLLNAPRQYALSQSHKHLPEMTAVTGLSVSPIFCPVVADFYSGMAVTVPLFASQLARGGVEDIRAVYKKAYDTPMVFYSESAPEDGFISALSPAGKDSMEITVAGSDERILLLASFDNLGKGASGAAIQCMNIVLGLDETSGLVF